MEFCGKGKMDKKVYLSIHERFAVYGITQDKRRKKCDGQPKGGTGSERNI